MTAEAAAVAAPPHPYRWAMLAGVWLIYYCFGLTVVAMAPLVGPITAELGLSHAAMGGILGAWPLVYIAAAAPCGVVLDRFGLRRSLFLATIVVGLSGMLRALAPDHLTLYLAVAVFGLGGPLISVGAPKLIGLWFDGKERGLAMGLYITGPALGNITALALTSSVMMPLLGGHWRRVLLSYAAFVLAVAAVWLALSAHPASREVERSARAQPGRRPLLVFLDLMRARPVQLVLLMSVGIFFFNHGLNNWLPEILRRGGMDAGAAGLWAAIPTAVGIAGALVVPRLAVARRRPAILLALFVCGGAAAQMIGAAAGPLLVAGLVLQGVARGSMTVVLMLVLMDTREVEPRHLGAAGGLFFSAAEIGGVLGPLTMGTLYDLTGGFAAARHVLTAVCLALVALLWALERSARGAAGRGALA